MLTPDAADDPSLYPSENPNPVLRADPNGLLLFANRASDGLLAAWGTSVGTRLPDALRQRIDDALASGQRSCISVTCGGRTFELDLVAIPARGYVNLYGRDITGQEAARREREAALASLQDAMRALSEREAALRATYEAVAQSEAKYRLLFDSIDEDIAERKRLEVRIRQSEAQARDLIRYAPTGIYEVDFRTGRFRSVNDAMCEILGYSREELLAMTAFELLDDDGKVLFADRVRRTLAGQAIDPAVEYRVIKKDGSAIYSVLNSRLTYTNGQADGAFVIAHDVTERRLASEGLRLAAERLEQRVRERTAELERANEALSQSEASLRYQATVLDNVNDAIVAYSAADLRITAWNRRAEEQYGWPAEEALGGYAPEVVGSQLDPKIRAEIVQMVGETGGWRGELRHTRRDGTPIIVETTSTALRDDSGRVVGHVTANRDITERKRLEDELRANREQLKNLAHRLVERQESERMSVAHELYNDEGQRLAALLLELGALEKEVDGNQALCERIRRMRTSLNGVLFDMHSLAVDLRPASLDRLGLMPALRQYAEGLGAEHGLRVQVEVSGMEKALLSPDAETMLYRIAQEAVTNAVRHAHAGQVGIMAMLRDAHLVLVIEDDGAGFDVEEAVRSRGLGIAGMRERTEMLGGRLVIESEPGKGTAVYIEAPYGGGMDSAS